MSDRKREHIELTFKSQTTAVEADSRFIYEPLLSEHPIEMQVKGLSLAEAFLRINPDYL